MRADFRRSRLSDPNGSFGADLRNSNMLLANLDDAWMARSFLEGACLDSATFRRAHVSDSVFRQMDISSGRLPGP
ncbi:MAG: pentapeptide repeat-containing protein [Rhodobacter sp.]|nr:pentapeptide repeat-containing protein [Rhodobacter sp.]